MLSRVHLGTGLNHNHWAVAFLISEVGQGPIFEVEHQA